MASVLKRVVYLNTKIQSIDLNKWNHREIFKYYSLAVKSSDTDVKEEKFRVLELYPKSSSGTKKRVKRIKPPNPPRTTNMTPDMDWVNIWPGPKTFHPASVPLPLHQGCNKHGPPPDKVANTELMKIPNFLHLTPPAIERHCKALKKFCTEWPENLKSEEDIEKHFPVEIINSDYCHSSCSIRDPKSRIMSLRIKLKNLKLDNHSKDKFLRIVGPRYDPSTDYVTLTTDNCPIKKQNYDYLYYLITAIYFESWKFEDWEKNKTDEDMEIYIFSQRKSFRNIKDVFDYNNRKLPDLEDFAKAVEDWQNKGDDKTVIEKYKEAVTKVLFQPSLEVSN